MTLLAPVLLAAILIIPVFLTTITDKTSTVQVLDESGLFVGKFKDTPQRKYLSVKGDLETLKTAFLESDQTALLYIPKLNLDNPTGIRLYAKTNISLDTKLAIEDNLQKEIENLKYQLSGIDQALLDKIKTDISITTTNLSKEGEKENNAFLTTAVGYAGAFLIYMFIFIYGVQIMRGVIEEKTSRIVEVIISSVKPFQLMMGKILGIAAVGLTQFLLWVILSSIVTTAVTAAFKDKISPAPTESVMETPNDMPGRENAVTEIIQAGKNLNIPLLLGCFVFYFLGGYLLYGALFGAVGAAVDNETDTQQFMLPITIPLILTFVISQTVIIRNPDGAVAFWMSVIPFTSPIAMMLRLPFGVPVPELLLSMGLLVLGFVGTTWLAARIYRVGILMYGKKVNYRELSKWIFYKA